jgi:hypothetical protein
MSDAPALYDLDEIRRRVSLEALVGKQVKLQRAGRGWKGLCPFHQERTPSFTVNDEKGFYHCFGCGAHGDVFEWVIAIEGVGFREAARRLADGAEPVQKREIEQRAPKPRAVHDMVESSTVGRHIWATAGPARGEIVENWLRARGLDPDGIPGALDRLRFHRNCPVVPWRVHEDARDAWLTAPAMVAGIADEHGSVWGVHCTYLATDGRTKARLPMTRTREERPTRKIWGRYKELSVHLTELRGAGPLVVGEGVETVWSYCQNATLPYRAAAALSLQNLQGLPERLRGGAVPLWNPVPADDCALFTIEDPGEVIVLVDADMKPLKGQKVQIERGARPIVADIGPEQRARLCAELAMRNWKRAGAERVTAVRPRMGLDFGDVAMEAAA